jgi:hypothetical protein
MWDTLEIIIAIRETKKTLDFAYTNDEANEKPIKEELIGAGTSVFGHGGKCCYTLMYAPSCCLSTGEAVLDSVHARYSLQVTTLWNSTVIRLH